MPLKTPSKWMKNPLLSVFFFFVLIPTTRASIVILSGNSTLLSPNRTFELGFFTVDAGSTFYLGIWYASLPIRTYVWVANRLSPVHSSLSPPTASLTGDGQLAVADSSGSLLWLTDNRAPATSARLLDTGNLVLLTSGGDAAWQSFDFPADTWLPNMTVTNLRPLVSWRGPSDPSPGLYSLRLQPPDFGEFELLFNGSVRYWSTGNWTGSRFAGVPEMTVPYIYSFRFLNPFTPDASFFYSEATPPEDFTVGPVLSRFAVDSSGQLMQYMWSSQAASWNMFWSRPERPCRVYGRCGSLGFCDEGLRPCQCLPGLSPADPHAWSSGDFSAGCTRVAEAASSSSPLCNGADVFEDVGAFDFEGATTVSIAGMTRERCEDSCNSNCSCFGIKFNEESMMCQNLHGDAYNLRNSTTSSQPLYLRVSSSSSSNGKGRWKTTSILILSICGFFAILVAISLISVLLIKLMRLTKGKGGREEEEEEEGIHFPVTNLKVFTYKELSAATRGFSEKIGHGGFGAVFRGELPPDSTHVAVKRLERPGGGDREFRAEVRTIGSIQHVNLVRLRGFCSDDPHRLLVYDYMPNGSLSAYLTSHRDRNRPPLSWQARFRIAVGTARGIAYLHEECRDCIIHCDIKPENILLDGEYNPKVSDFGLAKLMGRDLSRVLATMRGTWGYVAPEWISGVAITAKADVYSYGMMVFEIISGRRNLDPAEAESPGFFPCSAARKLLEGDVIGMLDHKLEGEAKVEDVVRACKVACWCIQDDENSRPTMGQVVQILEGLLEVGVPPVPRVLQIFGENPGTFAFFSDSCSSSHVTASLGT